MSKCKKPIDINLVRIQKSLLLQTLKSILKYLILNVIYPKTLSKVTVKQHDAILSKEKLNDILMLC